jgi:hypothetical protein
MIRVVLKMYDAVDRHSGLAVEYVVISVFKLDDAITLRVSPSACDKME